MVDLPKDWRLILVDDIATELKSGLSRKLSLQDIGLPVIRSNNLVDGGDVNFQDIKYWYVNDPQGANTANYVLRDGDLLINFINSISAIGKCSLFHDGLYRDCIYTTNIMRMRVNRSTIWGGSELG